MKLAEAGKPLPRFPIPARARAPVKFEKQIVESQSWRRERYHAPSDDLQQPIDFEAAAGFNGAYLQVVEAVANRAQRPSWNSNTFFKRFAR